MRHIKIFLSVYLSKNSCESGSAKPEVVRSSPLKGARGKGRFGESVEAKEGNYFVLTGYRLKPTWPFVIGGS